MAGQSDKVMQFKISQSKGFLQLLDITHKQHPPKNSNVLIQPIISLDPGETTGVAEFDGDDTITVYQQTTKDIGLSFDWLAAKLIGSYNNGSHVHKFEHLRFEDYRVYEWKVADHAWSPVHTIQWIGAIRVAAHVTGTPNSWVMANVAKNWWTDSKLEMFGLNPKGLRHGRDALRHLLYYLLFPSKGD